MRKGVSHVQVLPHRVLEIINTELCFGNPPMKCKCYTDNEVRFF